VEGGGSGVGQAPSLEAIDNYFFAFVLWTPLVVPKLAKHQSPYYSTETQESAAVKQRSAIYFSQL